MEPRTIGDDAVSVPDRADRLTALEIAVLQAMRADLSLPPRRRELNPDDVVVTERDFTGVGVFTSLAPSDAVRLFAPGTSLRWGKPFARLNADRIEAGFSVFVDDGVVNTIEGHLWGGEEWPETIDRFELYADFDDLSIASVIEPITPAEIVDRTLALLERRPPMYLGAPADVGAFEIFLCGLLHGVDTGDAFAATSQSARFNRFRTWIAEQRGTKEQSLAQAMLELTGGDGQAALRELFRWWNRFRAEGH